MKTRTQARDITIKGAELRRQLNAIVSDALRPRTVWYLGKWFLPAQKQVQPDASTLRGRALAAYTMLPHIQHDEIYALKAVDVEGLGIEPPPAMGVGSGIPSIAHTTTTYPDGSRGYFTINGYYSDEGGHISRDTPPGNWEQFKDKQ